MIVFVPTILIVIVAVVATIWYLGKFFLAVMTGNFRYVRHALRRSAPLLLTIAVVVGLATILLLTR